MNQLKVHQQQTIVALHQQGWSGRRIARELGLHRKTVRRYLAAVGDSKSSTNPRTGSAAENSASSAPAAGADPALEAESPDNPRSGVLDLGGAGPDRLCEPWKEGIEAALAVGLSIQRIYQDLVAEHGFAGSYDSVWRFVRRLERVLELPFRRIEVEPGAELQVDFGQGAWVIDEKGQRRRTHLFRAVLGHSRKGYSEAVWRQTTEIVLRCLENAFRYLGEVTASVIIDNLRAAVSRADWYDPELNPKLEEFCRHYGTVILPCKPKMPRHNGRIRSRDRRPDQADRHQRDRSGALLQGAQPIVHCRDQFGPAPLNETNCDQEGFSNASGLGASKRQSPSLVVNPPALCVRVSWRSMNARMLPR